MQNYQSTQAQVVAVFETMVVPANQEEQGKAQLTRATAWQIHLTKNPNIGLLSKTSGTQVGGLSVDVLMDRTDGSWVDCASSRPAADSNVEILPVWVDHPESNLDPAWMSRWVQPTPELANAPGPLKIKGTPPKPPDPPVPIPPTPPVEPMPPMPTEWSSAPFRSMAWYSDMSPRLDAVYCNLFTAPGKPLRHGDYGGWGNWVWHIVEMEESVDQVVAEMKQSDEYKALHP